MMLLVPFVLAILFALALTPPGIRFAWAIGYLDHPEARKLHTSATALLGGIVVFVSALAAWLAEILLHRTGPDPEALFLLGGALVALLVGLWDDRFGMRPSLKLLGQGSAAVVLMASGAI